jgi:hypothetical protein
MSELHQAAVIDDGTGVYFWHGHDRHSVGEDWVFMALFRCDQCGREVTIVRFEKGSVDERSLSRVRACPGGCGEVRSWLQPRG